MTSEGASVQLALTCVNVPVFHPKLMSPCLVVSAEFDKFLEERAKVADSASPPPGGHPARALGGSQKKAERTEDTLFAL